MLNIIANPFAHKGKGEKLLNKAEEKLRAANVEFRIFRSEHEGNARKFAEALTGSGETNLVVIGGDGTLNEVLCGIQNPEECILGIVPAGTGNDFAEAANIPFGLKALDLILHGDPQYTDYLQFADGNRSMNIAGVGMDVDILRRCEKMNTNKRSKYAHALISSVFHYSGVHVKTERDGVTEEYDALIATVCNGKQFGGGIKFCPEAEIDDGLLDLVVVEWPKRSRYVWELLKLKRGKLMKSRISHRVLCKKAVITPVGDNWAQFDGELREVESLDAEIVTGKLRVFRGENKK
ncbi:MAG: diacylglycerol kinase family lipid kinase, partial [Clostridiales bacterium]|nr:diacylglycerol kinase family lipid kinase [Clostridiales bacterium]